MANAPRDRVGESTGEIPRHQLLLKLLKMTTSANDGEALTAMRKANDLLQVAGWDWDRLLSGKITVVGDPFGNLQRPQERPPVNPANFTQPQAPKPTAPPPQRAARAKTKINYNDIFTDAQTFGRPI